MSQAFLRILRSTHASSSAPSIVQALPALVSSGLCPIFQAHLSVDCRDFSAETSTKDDDVKNARKAYKTALTGLRSQWVKEREAADKDKRRRQAEWRAAMDMGVQHRKARNMQLKAERSQEQVELQERQEAAKAQAREEGATWRKATQTLYDDLRSERHTALLEQSRNWIRAEDLNARIEKALDNPVPLMK